MKNQVKVWDISKRFRKDDRGWSVTPLVSEFSGFQAGADCHIVSLNPGAIRGNHMHTFTHEWIAVWGGEIQFAYLENTSLKNTLLTPEQATLIFIPAQTYHAFKNLGKKECYLFSYFEKKPLNYDQETHWKTLIS